LSAYVFCCPVLVNSVHENVMPTNTPSCALLNAHRAVAYDTAATCGALYHYKPVWPQRSGSCTCDGADVDALVRNCVSVCFFRRANAQQLGASRAPGALGA